MSNRVLRYATVTEYIGQMRIFITPCCTNFVGPQLSSLFQQMIKYEIPDVDISFSTIYCFGHEGTGSFRDLWIKFPYDDLVRSKIKIILNLSNFESRFSLLFHYNHKRTFQFCQ